MMADRCDDCGVDCDVHKSHHDFLREFMPLLREYIEERRESRRRWDSIRASALGSAVTIVVGGVFGFLAWVGKLVLDAIDHH
jgi:hypothetical protein